MSKYGQNVPLPSLIDFIEDMFTVDNGCWEWRGPMSPYGYGRVRRGRKMDVGAHRVLYELLIGPIPIGLDLDHLCRNRKCVRPDHLEPVTRGENNLRGNSPAAVEARMTHCINGHPFDETNTMFIRRKDPNRSAVERRCRICDRLRRQKGNQKR